MLGINLSSALYPQFLNSFIHYLPNFFLEVLTISCSRKVPTNYFFLLNIFESVCFSSCTEIFDYYWWACLLYAIYNFLNLWKTEYSHRVWTKFDLSTRFPIFFYSLRRVASIWLMIFCWNKERLWRGSIKTVY